VLRPLSGKDPSRRPKCHLYLDLRLGASQTFLMAHTYMLFDFGADEDKAQQARHKLEGWKQAFRLDKKLQVKFDRGEDLGSEASEAEEAPKKAEKPKSKSKAKTKTSDADGNGSVKLLVRLYFSAHEKLSEQQWLARIPADDLFKGAAPKVVHEGEPEFPEVLKQFESLS
jgi:hypothetical protein